MSEPVSTAEIEDVLSSIRRLVSNDVEAAQQNAASESGDVAPADKLILTADFRVSAPQDAPSDEDVSETPEQIAQTEAADDAPIEFSHVQDQMPSEEAAADFEAHVDTQLDADIIPQDDAAAASQDIIDAFQDAEPHVEDVAADKASALESTIAELEAAIGQQDGDWEPDGSDFEEDAEAEEVMSEPVQDWIDGTAQEVKVETTDASTDDDATNEAATEKSSSDLFGDEESVIDEEALRDMVSDIVRQELQGALGERITRNVRKLVRREINRVLASQEFE